MELPGDLGRIIVKKMRPQIGRVNSPRPRVAPASLRGRDKQAVILCAVVRDGWRPTKRQNTHKHLYWQRFDNASHTIAKSQQPPEKPEAWQRWGVPRPLDFLRHFDRKMRLASNPRSVRIRPYPCMCRNCPRATLPVLEMRQSDRIPAVSNLFAGRDKAGGSGSNPRFTYSASERAHSRLE